MTTEAKGSMFAQLLEDPAGVIAATYFLEAVIKGAREKVIEEEIEPMEATFKMDPVSSAILDRRVDSRIIASADRRALCAESLAESRQRAI